MADAFRSSMNCFTLNLCFVILRLLSIFDGGWKVSRIWKRQHLLLLCLCRAETVFGQVRYSVQEEMAKGSFVGNIAQDLGLDVKRLKSGRARVFTEDGREYFGLNIDKGTLEVKERIDREELCGSVSPCSLHFQIILDNPMELHRIDVEILDINDHAPAFAEKEIVIPISESAIPGARFSLESAKDPDVGDNALQSYLLKPTDHFILKLESRPDGTKYVEMLLKTALDRESQENLNLVLTAIDGGTPPKSGNIKILVNILDVNDNPPVFTQTVYKASLQENSAKGIVFLTVHAADADTGTNGEVTYSFSQSSHGVSEAFNIDPITGEILVKGNIDYERNKQYEIIVKATDQGGLTDTSKVLIDILDVNDNAPVITVMSLSSPIPENAAPDTVVAMLNIKDADSGKNGQIRCSIDADLPFRIKSTSSNFHSLVTERVLDREMVSEYNVTITAIDGGSPTYSSKKTLTLKISDINDNAPHFEKQSYTAYVMENNIPGVSIYSVKADDKDFGNNAHISYLLEDTQTNGYSVSSYISVNSETGSIHGVRTFDFEQIKEFHIRITAQDAGSPPLRGNASVHIIIQDQNDNAPQILYPVQTGGSSVAEMVPRSADVGYLVTKVVAVDVDSGQNAWLSYKLQKATDRALFEVGSQNGEIRTIRPVSDKDAMKQRLTVIVEDNGQPSRSATVNVNVMVADSFPEVLSEFSDNTHDKDYNDNLTFYLVLALAVVSFLFILSLVVIISVKIYRWRQSRIFYQSNLPVIPYYPTLYSDAGGTGTLQHMHNYEVYMTNDSRKSDCKFVRPSSQSVLMVDPNSAEIMERTLREKNIMDENDLNPSNTEWHFAQNQRPGPSGKNRFHTTQERSAPYGIMRAGPSPDESGVPMSGTATGPWPNPPTEAEQLQALMAAANEANEASGPHLRPGTMGRCGPQFAMQHMPDYRQNVYIPGSTATLLAASPQQALPPPQEQGPPPIQAEPPKPAQTPASKKKSAKKDKK
ncbi:protocadherin beta-16-like isoform X1 [Brienomyrus brachyistius]|uniref:protocadherin beta-16-like isoform X1 n=1 Tax=Brienomyrus brachyistius TaxID=42636 RepID=UPI0020B205C1|nr:protocadherin beta-16-like isoform X1 [Brienomyrus brachyistius]